MTKVFSIFFLLSIFTVTYAAKQFDYGIVSAMPVEAAPIHQLLKHEKAISIHDMTYYTGTIAKHSVVCVTSGMGRIAAAALTALMVQNFKPKHLVFVGVAGSLSPKVKVGDVVISKRIYNAEHYYFESPPPAEFISANTHAINPEFIAPNSELLKAADNIKAPFPILFGTIVSSDNFPTLKSELEGFTAKNYLAIESEGVALGEVADFFHTPWIVIRGISNQSSYYNPHDLKKIKNKLQKHPTSLAAKHAALVLKKLIQRA